MSFQLEQQLHLKQKELEQLKQINSTIETMKTQLDLLSKQVKQIEVNSKAVANIMKIWESISRAISEASIGLLQYVEKDYEVGPWKKPKLQGFNATGEKEQDNGSQNRELRETGQRQDTSTSRVNLDTTDGDKWPPLPEPLVRMPIPEELLSDGEDSEDELEGNK